MLPSTILQFVQPHPTVTTNSPKFHNIGLCNEECQELAYQLVESYLFPGQTTIVYNSKGGSSQTILVTLCQVGFIKKYFRAFIDVDRSALEKITSRLQRKRILACCSTNV